MARKVKAETVRVRVSFEYEVNEAVGDSPFSARYDRQYIKDKLDSASIVSYKRLRVERVPKRGERK